MLDTQTTHVCWRYPNFSVLYINSPISLPSFPCADPRCLYWVCAVAPTPPSSGAPFYFQLNIYLSVFSTYQWSICVHAPYCVIQPATTLFVVPVPILPNDSALLFCGHSRISSYYYFTAPSNPNLPYSCCLVLWATRHDQSFVSVHGHVINLISQVFICPQLINEHSLQDLTSLFLVKKCHQLVQWFPPLIE